MSASVLTINPLITGGCMVGAAGLGVVAAALPQPAAAASPGAISDGTPRVKSADEIMALPKGRPASSFWQLRLPFPISVPQRVIDRAVFVYGRMGVKTTPERISAVSRDGSLFLLRDESGALALMDGDTSDGWEPLYVHEHFLPSIGKYFRDGRLLEAELIVRDGDVILINVEEKGEMAWREDAATGCVQKISAHYFPHDEVLFSYGRAVKAQLIDRVDDCALFRKKSKKGEMFVERFDVLRSDTMVLPDKCYFPDAQKYFLKGVGVAEAVVVTENQLSGHDRTFSLDILERLPTATVLLTTDRNGNLHPLKREVYPQINLATDHRGIAHIIGSFRVGRSSIFAVGIPESYLFRGEKPTLQDIVFFKGTGCYERASKDDIREAARRMDPGDFLPITFPQRVIHIGRAFDFTGDPDRIAVLVKGESGLEIADDEKIAELARVYLKRRHISLTRPDRVSRNGKPVRGEFEARNEIKIPVYRQRVSMRIPFLPNYFPNGARRKKKVETDADVKIYFTHSVGVMIEAADEAQFRKRIRALMLLLKNTPFEAARVPKKIEIYGGKSSEYGQDDEDRSIYGNYSNDDILRIFLFDTQIVSGAAESTLWHEMGHGLINKGRRARSLVMLAIKAADVKSRAFFSKHAPAGPAYHRFSYEEHGAESVALYLSPQRRESFVNADPFMASVVEYLMAKRG